MSSVWTTTVAGMGLAAISARRPRRAKTSAILSTRQGPAGGSSGWSVILTAPPSRRLCARGCPRRHDVDRPLRREGHLAVSLAGDRGDSPARITSTPWASTSGPAPVPGGGSALPCIADRAVGDPWRDVAGELVTTPGRSPCEPGRPSAEFIVIISDMRPSFMSALWIVAGLGTVATTVALLVGIAVEWGVVSRALSSGWSLGWWLAIEVAFVSLVALFVAI